MYSVHCDVYNNLRRSFEKIPSEMGGMMETLAVASVSLIIGFLFGVWFYWKIILPYLAKKLLGREKEVSWKKGSAEAYEYRRKMLEALRTYDKENKQ